MASSSFTELTISAWITRKPTFQTPSKLDFVQLRCIANCMAQAGKQCVRNFHHLVFGTRREETGRMPELLAHACHGIREGGLCLGVPSSLTNRQLAVAILSALEVGLRF